MWLTASLQGLGVFDVVDGGLKVVELAPDVSMDDVNAVTEANIVS